MLRVRATEEWYFRYRLGGRSVLSKLGDYPRMSLPEARAKARALGDLVRAGIDPEAKEREDAEEARRAAEREARRATLGQLLTGLSRGCAPKGR